MARVKVTTSNIKSKLTLWAQNNNLTDELIFLSGEIDEKEWQSQAWQAAPAGANMVIKFDSDATSGFRKITFVEKLT